MKGLDVAEGDLLELLGKAITCAVLGKAGPQRSRQMGVLLKDERVESLNRVPGLTTHAQVCNKDFPPLKKECVIEMRILNVEKATPPRYDLSQ